MFKINNTHTALLILENGDVFYGASIGKKGLIIGELCFNTAMTGYQEAISDPSYASQILMFTFPHIGITGINKEDIESKKIHLNGLIVKNLSKDFSNWRASGSLNEWLIANNVVGISNINTRMLTIKLREKGALKAAIVSTSIKDINISNIIKKNKKLERPYKYRSCF